MRLAARSMSCALATAVTLLGGAMEGALADPVGAAGAGSYQALPFPANGRRGILPGSPVVLLPGGDLVGAAAGGGVDANGTIYRLSPAHEWKVIHRFSYDDVATDGDLPAGVLLSSDGWLYGMTTAQGPTNCGTLYRMTPEGTHFERLHVFNCQKQGSPGQNAWLVQRPNGDIFGILEVTAFKLSASGVYSTFYDFVAERMTYARGGMNLGSDGSLYGALPGGGRSSRGAIFRIAPDDTFSIVFDFADSPSGANTPLAPPVERDGWLYGMTHQGGLNGLGALYKLRLDGSDYTEIEPLSWKTGFTPFSPLMLGRDGNLYGATAAGGPNSLHDPGSGDGILFSIGPDDSIQRLHAFGSRNRDGASPTAAPVQQADGTLVGPTELGGSQGEGQGTIYWYTPLAK